jgi:hypothetical protein
LSNVRPSEQSNDYKFIDKTTDIWISILLYLAIGIVSR